MNTPTTSWTAPDVERHDPAQISGERAALEAWLDYHRETLLWKCAGLTSEELKRRSVPPSSMSLLGLVRHMTEVERWWFRMNATAEPVSSPYSDDDDRDGDFNRIDAADAAADLAAYAREIETCRDAVRDMDLDAVIPSPRPNHADRDLRWIYVHMIEEYARHNGHADLLRECIDGVTGD